MKNKGIMSLILTLVLVFIISGCSSESTQENTGTENDNGVNTQIENTKNINEELTQSQDGVSGVSYSLNGESALDTADMFTEKDLEQTVIAAKAERIELESDIVIDESGDYIISGSVNDTMITIDVGEENNVRIALDNVNITNQDKSAIYVKSADKVFITLLQGENTLQVTGDFKSADGINFDSVIYATSDLTFNGTGTLNIISAFGNGVSTNDDLKITGGTYNIACALDAFEANDSIRIYDGTFDIQSRKDAFHCENTSDATGYIYILNCDMKISASDDAIRGNSIVQIDGGKILIESCTEGIEGTFLQINDGEIDIYSSDDGINAAKKSNLETIIEVNGGTITIDMASGDTDGFDSNGNLYVNGGLLNITANSAIDVDNIAQLNGGEVYVNGEQITEITAQQHGGGMRKDGGSDRPNKDNFKRP